MVVVAAAAGRPGRLQAVVDTGVDRAAAAVAARPAVAAAAVVVDRSSPGAVS